MLEFWFESTTTLARKILILLMTITLAVGLYLYKPLPSVVILMFTGTGLVFLICRYARLQIAKNDPSRFLFRVFTWIPLALILAVLFMKTMDDLLILGIQGLAFMALSVFIFSPLARLSKSTSTES
ncbi:hypothetical protein [Acinetobacter sp. ANC 3791]|uniref:hypothetical protein n=1 Tax=Acinetobacter sp. ANC 3791 TaxID=2529836 RepID=UPI001038F29C|nr:hypothetical protein [Acinetobacter sp. ANC 3791]TCB84155.1 hypothetical protein E0H90_08995 [Acinetobacter sp. ANC 3791]